MLPNRYFVDILVAKLSTTKQPEFIVAILMSQEDRAGNKVVYWNIDTWQERWIEFNYIVITECESFVIPSSSICRRTLLSTLNWIIHIYDVIIFQEKCIMFAPSFFTTLCNSTVQIVRFIKKYFTQLWIALLMAFLLYFISFRKNIPISEYDKTFAAT